MRYILNALQDKMLMDMELRNFSPLTIKAYLGQVEKFTKMFNKSPEEMVENSQTFGHQFTNHSESISQTIGYFHKRFGRFWVLSEMK